MTHAAEHNTPPRLGLIGCGRVASAQHLPILRDLPGKPLRAIAEADATNRERAKAAAPGVQAFDSIDAMLAESDIDAVVICLPTPLHAPTAIAAFEAGKHVYVEKPLGVDLAEARRVSDAQQRSGRFGQIGFNYRFHPAHRGLRAALQAGQIGDIVAVTACFCSPPRPLPDWKQSSATGGGVLLDLFVHHADLIAYLLDQPIVRVCAAQRSIHNEEDTAAVACELADGTLVQSTVSAAAAQADRIDVLGTRGALSVDRFADQAPRPAPLTQPGNRKGRLASAGRQALRGVGGALRPPGEPSFALALRSFVEAVRDARTPEPGLSAGLAAAAVIDAARASLASGRWADVETTQSPAALVQAGSGRGRDGDG